MPKPIKQWKFAGYGLSNVNRAAESGFSPTVYTIMPDLIKQMDFFFHFKAMYV